MKKKLRRITDTFDIPSEIAAGFYIELFSDREFVFSGDVKISKLEENSIEIIYNNKVISISGSELKIDYYTSGGIKITGSIEKIEFLQKE
ncbi:MAG: YabP/YqfC family sporulation protein [Oscillospiraceae bacterium]|nr:YabP/YqfC family sporulation protein [Oscillospiraceae bacterium]